MKLKEGFITHESKGEHIMVPGGNIHFAGLIRSNNTAAFIVEQLKKETTKKQIVDEMYVKYDETKDVIEKDVDKILNILRDIGAVDD